MKRGAFFTGDRWGIVFYLAVLAASLIVQAIEEGSSPWTIFKALSSLAVLLIATALISAQPGTTPRLGLASWIILAAVPWGINYVVEPAFVFSLAASDYGIEPHQAFHLLMAGIYSLSALVLVAFMAARPLRLGIFYSWYSILLAAIAIVAGDLLASTLIYGQSLHLVGHLLPSALMLVGLAVAWTDMGIFKRSARRTWQ